MTKLRNIGYLRFGSKIRQGFAGGIISLTPPLSLSPLWTSWAENESAREGAHLLYWGGGGACRPPAGRAGCLPPLHRAAGSRQGPPRKIFLYLFTYRFLPPPAGR